MSSKKTKFYLLILMAFFISADGFTINIGRNWQISQLLSIVLFLVLLLEALKVKVYVKFAKIPTVVIGFLLVNIVVSNYFMPDTPKYIPIEDLSYWQSFGVTSYMYLFWILLNVVMLLVIYNTIENILQFTQIIKVLIVSSAIFSMYGLLQYIVVDLFGEQGRNLVYAANEEYLRENYVRLLSFGREPLYFACFLNVVIGLMLSGIYYGNKETIFGIKKEWFYAIFLVDICALLLTKSLGALLGLIALIIVFTLIIVRSTRRIDKLKVFLSLLFILMFIYLFVQLNYTLIESKVDRMLNPESGYGRIISLIEGIQLFKDKFLLGIGMGNTVFFISNHQIHNAYLNIAVELGIIGIILFMSFIIYIVGTLYKVTVSTTGDLKVASIGLLLGLTAILTQLLSFYGYMINMIWFLFAMSLTAVKLAKTQNIKFRLLK